MRPWTLGTTRKGSPVSLTEEERSTHLHVIGGSGRGKSKLLEHLIRQDIIERRGLCLIDPDGYLYEWLTAWCAEHDLAGSRKIILFDPHAPDSVFGFNPLRADGDLSTHAEAMQAACAQVWGGESMQDKASLNMGLRSVFFCLAHHKLTLVESLALLSPVDRQNVRRRLTEDLPDPAYRAVWERYNELKPQQFDEQLGSTYRRLFEFLDAPLVRAIVGQRDSVIDFRKCMDEGAIVLVNLQRKGALTDGKARLLGTLIVNDLFQRALTRPQKARPFTLYIDECTDYLNTDITRSIDRARKFGLRLVLSHQRLGQLEDEDRRNILSAVMSVQSKVIFGGLEVPDAERLAREIFSGEFNLNAAKRTFATPIVVDHVPEWLLAEGEARGKASTKSAMASTGGSQSETTQSTTTRPLWTLNIFAGAGTRSEAQTTATSHERGTSQAETNTDTQMTGRREALRPVLKLGPGIPKSMEELVYEATTRLKELPRQHAILKPIGRRSTQFQVASIQPVVAEGRRVGMFAAKTVKLSGLGRAYETVVHDIDERMRALGSMPLPPTEPEDFLEPMPTASAPSPRTRAPLNARPQRPPK